MGMNDVKPGSYTAAKAVKAVAPAQANNLAGILDAYNNNFLCFEF